MKWYRLDDRGRVVATASAPDKYAAQAILGPGYIVSAISYALDSRYRPTLQRDDNGAVALAAMERVVPPLTEGYLTTESVAKRLGINEQRVRSFARQLGLTPYLSKGRKSRRVFLWHLEQVAEMRRFYDDQPEIGHSLKTKAKRRASLLRYHAKRWGWLDPKPTTTPESV